MSDPLLPHLLDIVADPCSEGLILAGGLGIRLKQIFRVASGVRTLISNFPEARATQDMDFFLSLSFFVEKNRGAALRDRIERLQYRPVVPHFQFAKPFEPGLPQQVKLDFLARLPEAEKVRVKASRVGAGIDLHGRETPEGFSVEQQPLTIPVSGKMSNGSEVTANIFVPHAYSYLNLKTRAAYDWLRMERREQPRKANIEKHVLDVYVLTAMLTEIELGEAQGLAQAYRDHPIAREVRAQARELFADQECPGAREIQRQLSAAVAPAFFEGLRTALAVE